MDFRQFRLDLESSGRLGVYHASDYESELDKNKVAAVNCPVNIILINGKKVDYSDF